MIDRVAPTRRPDRPNDGTQRWEDLLFCHWRVPAASLRSLLPKSLEIDTFDGQAYIGVVPFKMRQIRPRWLPQQFAFNFLETNVRTYVVYKGQPGVFFFSLDANSFLAVRAARWGWSLPYFDASMSSDQRGDQLIYESRRRWGPGHHRACFRVSDRLGPSPVGSLEHFLLERYLLFIERRRGVFIGQVYHQPYEACLAIADEVSDSLISASGVREIGNQPDLVHYSPGVDVEVFGIVGPK